MLPPRLPSLNISCFTTLALVVERSATFCFVDLAGGVDVVGGEAVMIVAGEDMLTAAAGSEFVAAGKVGRYLEATYGGEADTSEDKGIWLEEIRQREVRLI